MSDDENGRPNERSKQNEKKLRARPGHSHTILATALLYSIQRTIIGSKAKKRGLCV